MLLIEPPEVFDITNARAVFSINSKSSVYCVD